MKKIYDVVQSMITVTVGVGHRNPRSPHLKRMPGETQVRHNVQQLPRQ